MARKRTKKETRDKYMSGQLHFLSEAQLENIHARTLRVLEEVGILFYDKESIALLKQHGATVDEKNMVKIPAGVVNDCIKKAPEVFTVYGRDEKHNMVLGGNSAYVGTGGRPTEVYDVETGQRRDATVRDVADLMRIAQAAEHIAFTFTPLEATDYDPKFWDMNNFFHAFDKHNKPIMEAVADAEHVEMVLRLADLQAGSREKLREKPNFIFLSSFISPLHMTDLAAQTVLRAARENIPSVCAPVPSPGLSVPASLDGALVQQNAESLAGVVLSQLAAPGSPFLYGTTYGGVDFKSGNFLFNSPTAMILNAAAIELAHYYKIPIYSTAGTGDSKISDSQCGAEKAMSILLMCLEGGNFIHLAAGLMDNGMIMSLPQMLVDSDIIGYAMRILEGIKFDESIDVVDLIRSVGPGGNFLGEDHTLKCMRSEYFFPKYFTQTNYDTWMQEGAKDIFTIATERTKEILAQPSIGNYDAAALKEIRKMCPQIEIF